MSKKVLYVESNSGITSKLSCDVVVTLTTSIDGHLTRTFNFSDWVFDDTGDPIDSSYFYELSNASEGSYVFCGNVVRVEYY